jgi:hypothetical protein
METQPEGPASAEVPMASKAQMAKTAINIRLSCSEEWGIAFHLTLKT